MWYVYAPTGSEPVYPLTVTDMRLRFPHVSFPSTLSDHDAAQFDCYPVQPRPEPAPPPGKRAVRACPEQTESGWIETWTLEDVSPEEIEAQWRGIREERNTLLTASDWTQIGDAPLSAVQRSQWSTYRQALRDITTQPDPFHIVWPQAPQ